jgi:hypothetical protein
LNKVGQLAASPVLRNILGQTSPKFDLAYAMDNRRILIANVAPPNFNQRRVLIANLAKGQIGEQASNLLGSLLLSHLQLITMARSDQAYTVVKREGQDDFWLNIGAAFMHQDGDGYNIMLQALPINGKIVLRPPKAQTEEPAQPPARENPRRDNNRDRRKDK